MVGIASSALFDLAKSDAVFRDEGEESYRNYQDEHLNDPLMPGVAFPFVQRLLSLNDFASTDDPLVEVIVMSRKRSIHRPASDAFNCSSQARNHTSDFHSRTVTLHIHACPEHVPIFVCERRRRA